MEFNDFDKMFIRSPYYINTSTYEKCTYEIRKINGANENSIIKMGALT